MIENHEKHADWCYKMVIVLIRSESLTDCGYWFVPPPFAVYSKNQE